MKVGITFGNFDVIHPGYMRLFKDAKENVCDKLIVGLHVDPTIERPHKIKPILNSEERTEILMGIKYIDEVVYYNTEQELIDLLKTIKPHIRIIGSDYLDRDFTGKSLTPEIYYHDRDHNWSTTKFKYAIASCINKIL